MRNNKKGTQTLKGVADYDTGTKPKIVIWISGQVLDTMAKYCQWKYTGRNAILFTSTMHNDKITL